MRRLALLAHPRARLTRTHREQTVLRRPRRSAPEGAKDAGERTLTTRLPFGYHALGPSPLGRKFLASNPFIHRGKATTGEKNCEAAKRHRTLSRISEWMPPLGCMCADGARLSHDDGRPRGARGHQPSTRLRIHNASRRACSRNNKYDSIPRCASRPPGRPMNKRSGKRICLVCVRRKCRP